ncbi:hypothetical protein NMY22_g5806 [Coprinellus aureogranulatus]|nr:hypothetical protein NMY22_g5806 [Coprinellus aureogranulatus]
MDGDLTPKATRFRKWQTPCFVLTVVITVLFTLRLTLDSSSTMNILGVGESLRAAARVRGSTSSLLSDAALEEILARGAPILGSNADCNRGAPTCDWMARVPDHTKLVHLNLPGTHDTATFTGNYTDARQKELLRYTGEIPPAHFYQCQQRSIFQMLNDGIRVFDLRYAYNPGNDTIGFYHSRALLAPTTTIFDVLYGYYAWLEQHPTETVLLSFNHEGNTGTLEDERLQSMIFDIFSKPTNEDSLVNRLKRRFWIQKRGELGTLGESRGKIILLQRFSYRLLQPAPALERLHGLDLGADRWTDNGDDIHLVYNSQSGSTAFIEDRYQITLPDSEAAASPDAYITSKYNVTTAHLDKATSTDSQTADQLFITFASAAYLQDPTEGFWMYPRLYALGDESASGVNARLLPYFQQRKGKRLGIIMLDFYDAVPGLVEAILRS